MIKQKSLSLRWVTRLNLGLSNQVKFNVEIRLILIAFFGHQSSLPSKNNERKIFIQNNLAYFQYPDPEEHPSIGFELYNAEDMATFSSRDVRSLLTSYLSATRVSTGTIDVADMLIQVYGQIQTQRAPKIVILLTNGYTEDPEELDQVVQDLHKLDVQIIPIAVSRKCR